MSCAAEPPTFPAEIDRFTAHFAEYREKHPSSTVPVYLLGDISHGYANEREKVINTNWDLFEHSIPNMSEFHFKNTDALFNETFGFSEGDSRKGIVDLEKLREIVARNASRWPVEEVTGYLELPGPKLGRDYSDWRLETMLNESLAAIKSYF
jgi:ribulose-phosphate 3-epimerase